jgi:hypothetical protein
VLAILTRQYGTPAGAAVVAAGSAFAESAPPACRGRRRPEILQDRSTDDRGAVV